ncbi:hypothetical protein Bbelb_204470 [Branchiostoma belcheri]|nr:hypothetical protein Bbelb_204470 [Branchiostoma belcheri]
MLGAAVAGLLWAVVDVVWIAARWTFRFFLRTVFWAKVVVGAVAGRSRMSGSKSFLHDLDSSIQRTLSTLYPPYHATAPVLLGQVCQIVEKRFRGDGMTFLSDWLIPAKPVLQCVQQEARMRLTLSRLTPITCETGVFVKDHLKVSLDLPTSKCHWGSYLAEQTTPDLRQSM